jgi:uncharacterized RDD family membrane protein YckC
MRLMNPEMSHGLAISVEPRAPHIALHIAIRSYIHSFLSDFKFLSIRCALAPKPVRRYDAVMTVERQLDVIVRLETPERIAFEYPLGGPFRRFMAYLIDLCVMGLLIAAASMTSMVLSLGSVSGAGLALVAYFLITWGYGAFFEGALGGQTPGKRVMALRVVSDCGVPITGAQAVLRNLVRVVDGPIPFCFLLGLSSMLMTRRFQRLGDLAAGTMVIVEDRRGQVGLVRSQDPRVLTVLDRLPVRIEASSDLSRALSDYVRRRHRFSYALREEMAEPLARPLRSRFSLPAITPADVVLCALYHRVFLGE